MRKGRRRISIKAGLPPGTILHIGEEHSEPIQFQVFTYREKEFHESAPASIDECLKFIGQDRVAWINIDGVHRPEVLAKTGDLLRVHPLALEDIGNTEQRPKAEEYDGQLFIVMKMLSYDDKKREIRTEQVSIILTANAVVTFQERSGDVFGPVRDRIRNNKGRLRRMGADYLCYCLVDIIVDNYYYILEAIGEQLEDLEEEIAANPDRKTLETVQVLKRELIMLRKSVWPMRELVATVEKRESALITKATQLYFRDVYDHTIELMDTLESLRDISSSLVDIYLSSISNRQNVVMKTLTLIATIFMPLTFITGVFGMNFENMPALHLSWGFNAVLILMVVISIIMIIYFKKSGWFR